LSRLFVMWLSGRAYLSIGSNGAKLLIRPLDHAQIFRGVSRGYFHRVRYGIATR
jgi:hypothetical protein